MDKWTMFKNYMHNELGITKEDIREWITDTIKDEGRKVLNQTYNSFNVYDFLRSELIHHDYFGSRFKQEVIKAIAEELAKDLQIKRIEK